MKRTLLGLLTVFVLLTAGCLSGYCGCSCEEDETTNHHEEVNFEGETNKEARKTLPSGADMGVPVYNENVDNSNVSNWSTYSNDELTKMGVTYRTTDGFQTVVDWYGRQTGSPAEISQDSSGFDQAIWRSQKDGWNITVTVKVKDMFTEIDIMKQKG
jgi:hypothetical protein